MSKSLRLSEKWFRRGLWLVAFIFAWFLIGLGSAIVADLPKVEYQQSVDDFLDPALAPTLKLKLKQAKNAGTAAQDALEQAQLKLRTAQANNQAAKDTFNNWLATRSATQRPDQDSELIKRTQLLDTFRQTQRDALTAVEAEQQAALDAKQNEKQAYRDLQVLKDAAFTQLQKAQRAQELRVFLYRLLLTLPLLAIAAWLFVKKRKGTYWPFVWGFIFFALFAFFIELVPYLPSYGGYIRYTVGILLTVVGGRYAIIGLQNYLERQKQAETLPSNQRRLELNYDQAQTRLAKGFCPGCERPVDLKDPTNDFCSHCGICLHDQCLKCNARKSSFTHYCYGCGEPSKTEALSI